MPRSGVRNDRVVRHATREAPAVIDIGTLGGPYAFATAINNHQQVVGQSIDAAETRVTAFLWEDGVMRDLSTAGLHFEIANDINDRGQIVGSGFAPDGRLVALTWQDGVLTELPVPAGASYCSPEAINDHGDIVGFCDQQPAQWGMLWRRSGDVVSLGPAPEGWSAGTVDINERGVVLGAAVDPANARHTWVWDDGVVTVVDNVPGGPLWMPTALNDRGQIVGLGRRAPTPRSRPCCRTASSRRCRNRRARRSRAPKPSTTAARSSASTTPRPVPSP